MSLPWAIEELLPHDHPMILIDEGWRALESGRTAIDGELPVNVSGGLKARGHPVGATGLAQVAEVVWQLRGQAEGRQLDGVRVGLTQNIGGFGCNNLVTILRRVT